MTYNNSVILILMRVSLRVASHPTINIMWEICVLFCFTAGYPAAQSTTHGYSQSAQGYGASGYDSTPAAAAATPAASQSYGSQPGYTAQSAYPGYGQQAAPTAPQRYVSVG